MKKIFYLFILLCVASIGMSCSDDDKNGVVISGNWDYKSPYLEFDYARDSVTIVMGQGMKKSIAVNDLKKEFAKKANEKMGDYFKGVNFAAGDKLEIKMQMADQSERILNASWKQDIGHIQVSLDSTELKALTNGAVSQIPPISFNYKMNGNDLQMYFDKAYVIIVYAMMEDMILDKMLLPMLGFPPGKVPQAMKDAMKAQIQGILKQTNRLEIGFTLSRP